MKFPAQRALLMVFGLFVIVQAPAQTFSSGSNGTDGALTFETPGTYIFNPKDTNLFPTPLDADNDGIFHFTTITIAAGVTVRFRSDVYAAPVIFLAQSTVTINGILDLSGEAAFNASNITQRRLTVPGSGGYGGGYPGIGNSPAGAALGPTSPSCSSGISNSNRFAVPLIGGSGGNGSGGSAGGAGGGAILIASSSSITGSGSIRANGGSGIGNAPGGGGGAIRLVAPAVTLTGNLNVNGGSNNGCGNLAGVIRVEGFQIGALSVSGQIFTATPFGLFISPTGIPALRVVTVGGIAVVPSPTGTFTVPDVTVNSNTPLPFSIQAENVPVGTVVTLIIFSENGSDLTIQSTPLAGSLVSSTATATATIPPGYSTGFVKATFTQ